MSVGIFGTVQNLKLNGKIQMESSTSAKKYQLSNQSIIDNNIIFVISLSSIIFRFHSDKLI